MKILVDAMGGDNAPLEIIKGSLQAKAEYNVDIILVGKEDVIKSVSEDNNLDISDVEIVNAEQVIETDEDANSVLKKKPDSSMAVALKLLSQGEGDAFVSAGNSGALCVGGTLITKRIKGIKRPGF
ncbi:MAG: phosphate--acyl-ACP acyltransferase, partial [Ruminococcus sp.]|nr:phosphate--acyl-ACP acyltransferase [Ruminococcus sp.]